MAAMVLELDQFLGRCFTMNNGHYHTHECRCVDDRSRDRLSPVRSWTLGLPSQLTVASVRSCIEEKSGNATGLLLWADARRTNPETGREEMEGQADGLLVGSS
jgi:hypothetical protein